MTFEEYLRKWVRTGGGSCLATVRLDPAKDYKPILDLDANTESVGPVRLTVIDDNVTMTQPIPPDQEQTEPMKGT